MGGRAKGTFRGPLGFHWGERWMKRDQRKNWFPGIGKTFGKRVFPGKHLFSGAPKSKS